MRRSSILPLALSVSIPALACAQSTAACDNAGLKLPAGFCATIFADSLRGVRSIAVAPNGDLFVAVQSTQSGGVVALRDAGKSGKAEHRERFASGFASSQVALFDNHLYVEMIPSTPP